KAGKGVGPFGDQLILLTTVGARSGSERTSPVMYHRDRERYVVVASKGGAPDNPGWYNNLKGESHGAGGSGDGDWHGDVRGEGARGGGRGTGAHVCRPRRHRARVRRIPAQDLAADSGHDPGADRLARGEERQRHGPYLYHRLGRWTRTAGCPAPGSARPRRRPAWAQPRSGPAGVARRTGRQGGARGRSSQHRRDART